MKRLAWLGAVLLAGCGTSSVDVAMTEETKATLAKFNAEGAPTVDFSVPGMHCESCVAHVESILAAQPGVKDVEVNLEALTAKVAVDDTEFDGEKAVAALVDMQFDEAKLITADGAAAGAEKAKSNDAGSESAPTDEQPVSVNEEAAKS
ncbi:heavy-metal-associated domain-containing protein [Lacipirellula limnantheis]|uniref:Heavy-metal-associated domain protein n=1 Tax=Lacipirellula limnantheis TaxID=2528024 RepID=A0A517U199_9BACT|nr:heavy metal-associated domain-containing protein [Lacipirellula limnantheis]QDT74390.1 Heavy-metal-associated domain protein [Lacipirellula limnantheis]